LSSISPVSIAGKSSEEWWQVHGDKIRDVAVVSNRTKFAISPFDQDEEGRYRCPLGHVAGLNIVSAPVVRAGSITGAGMYASDKYVGIKQGLLRPHRLLFVEPPVWRDLVDSGTIGWSFEVVEIEG
jgi:hypothetical protein